MQAVELDEAEERVWLTVPAAHVAEVAMLKELTWCYVIDRPSLAILQDGQRKVVRTLFERYQDAVQAGEFRLFPPGYIERLEAAETEGAQARAVIDLIAGLTETAAIQIYQRLSGISSGSLLGAPGELA